MRISIAALLVLVAACSHDIPLVRRPRDASRSLVIRNVQVFDAPRANLLDGPRDVVVRDGRIAAVAAPGVDAPGLPEIDGRGATLVPGLVDVHTHTGSTARPPSDVGTLPSVDENLAAFLYAGVTTVLDLGNLSPTVFRTRRKVTSGSQLGPHLLAAGPVFTAPGGHPAEVLRQWLPWYLRWYVVPRATREVATPDDGRRLVGTLLREQPDIVKIAIDAGPTRDVPRLAPDTIAAIVATAHAAGIRSIAHIGDSREAIDAVRAGVDALAHAPWREEISDEAVALVAAKGVPVVVTLAVWDVTSIPRRTTAQFLPIELEVASPDLLKSLLAPPSADPSMEPFVRVAAAAHDARKRNVAKLRAAGVRILAGSDGCNPGVLPGAGLHLELAKLVDAGMTPAEALRAATWENSRFLAGDFADFGEIAPGKRADLVLVKGNPAIRVEELGRITHVILDGTVLERRAPAPP